MPRPEYPVQPGFRPKRTQFCAPAQGVQLHFRTGITKTLGARGGGGKLQTPNSKFQKRRNDETPKTTKLPNTPKLQIRTKLRTAKRRNSQGSTAGNFVFGERPCLSSILEFGIWNLEFGIIPESPPLPGAPPIGPSGLRPPTSAPDGGRSRAWRSRGCRRSRRRTSAPRSP